MKGVYGVGLLDAYAQVAKPSDSTHLFQELGFESGSMFPA
jgi:hypothetical protein